MSRSSRGSKTSSAGDRTKSHSGKKSSGRRARSSSRKSSQHSGNVTTDHDTIRRWVEERGGHPATVRSTVGKDQEAGILRIDFPGYSGGESLQEIGWDEFFDKFEEAKLAFLYQDKTADGEKSRFNKLIAR